MKVAYLQIYCEVLQDLLVPEKARRKHVPGLPGRARTHMYSHTRRELDVVDACVQLAQNITGLDTDSGQKRGFTRAHNCTGLDRPQDQDAP